MANWQWASIFHAPAVISATSAASGYPVARVGVLDNHPLIRTWRSTSTIEQDIYLDLGGLRTVAAVAVLNTNSPALHLAWSSDGVSYTFFPGSPYAVARDVDGFRKFMLVHVGVLRYVLVRCPPLPPVVLGSPFFEIGQVVIAEALNTFPTNPMPDLVETVGRPYLRSGKEIAPVGLNRLTSEMQMMMPLSQSDQWRQLALLGQHTPILKYKNAGRSEQVELGRFRNDLQARIGGTTYSVNPVFEEMV